MKPSEIGIATSIRETDKAVLIQMPTRRKPQEQFWVPKSQIHDDSEVYKDGQTGKLIVSEWFFESSLSRMF